MGGEANPGEYKLSHKTGKGVQENFCDSGKKSCGER